MPISFTTGVPDLTPVGDLYNPFFTVSIYRDSPPPRVDAQGRADAVEFSGLDQSNVQFDDQSTGVVRNFSGTLTIESRAEGAGQATLTLMPPFEDAVLLADNPTIQPGAVMEIEYGYHGISTVSSGKRLFRLNLPSFDYGAETTITLTGYEMHWDNMCTRTTRRRFAKNSLANDLNIIDALVSASLGNAYEVACTQAAAANLQRPLQEDVEQTESDWDFFRRICKRNNVTFKTGPGRGTPGARSQQLILYTIDEMARTKRGYRLLVNRTLTDEFDVPVYAFKLNPDPSFFYSPEGLRGVIYVQGDLDRGTAVAAKLAASTLPDRGTAGGSTKTMVAPNAERPNATSTSVGPVQARPALQVDATGDYVQQPSRAEGAAEMAKQVVRSLDRWAGTTRGTFTIPGIPGIVPQSVIAVDGLGTTFSQNYIVMGTRHTLSPEDGYVTEVTVFSSPTADPRALVGTTALGQAGTVGAAPDGATVPPVDAEGRPAK